MLLNLTRLNYKSPYTLWQGKHPSEYLFKTDFGGLFNVAFSENDIIWSKGAYEFGLFNLKGESSPNDIKLKQTIIAVIEEFFHDNPNVLLYQCETGDNRQAMRARLFRHWFEKYEKKDRYFIKVVMIKDENVENYDAIIVRRDNPDFEAIVSEFERFADEMKRKPRP